VEDKRKERPQSALVEYPMERGGIHFAVTKKEVIRSRGLVAMEEQIEMQMSKIKEQIELLARQVEDLKKRKELSFQIYQAVTNFEPLMGKSYYLYEGDNNERYLSMISPKEWGRNTKKRTFLAKVKLLADRTWKILD